MKAYLLYTLVNYKNRHYMAMFRQFLLALSAFSDLSKFDLCVISDPTTLTSVKKTEELRPFGSVSYVEVPPSPDLYHALLRKFDIFQHPRFLEYDKILFLDCDILVQENLANLFRAVRARPNRLYAAQEGNIEDRYWTMNAYLPQDFEHMRAHNVRSFNAGTFLFIPSEEMRQHLIRAKAFGENYRGRHFYDQSIMNYYFLRNGLASISPYITKKLQMFPDTSRYYPRKMLMHISGIGRYKEKAPIMEAYLRFIKRHRAQGPSQARPRLRRA